MTNATPRSGRRVVVTGLGAVTPLGLNLKTTWESALAGKSGVGRITLFDTKDCSVTIAAQVNGYEPTQTYPIMKPRGEAGPPLTQPISPKDLKKMGRFIQFALGAGMEAYLDSGLDSARSKINPERMGVNIGVGMGGLGEIEDEHSVLLEKGFRRVSPFLIPQIITNLASGHLSILLNLKGPNLCNVSACASSAHSLGESLRMIQRGDVDIMIAGGAEAVISPIGVGAFANMRALSTRNQDPEKASRPYDIGRDGFVMGEGAGVLVFEEYEHAKARGAKIYGEMLGYAATSDAYHMTLPAPEGEGGFRAMKLAVMDAGLNPEQIGYVNSHGTSTPAGDAEEARAIARLFDRGTLHVSSTKSMTGHLLGAAGAVEAIFSLMAIKTSRIPPTINLEALDPKCAETGLNFCANSAVEKRLDFAVSNSFGFGGTNGSLVVGRI